MADKVTLFHNAEEVWFWFICAQTARDEGARICANQGIYIRPCEPSDILKILQRLHRHRRLNMNHFRVLRHYGLRMIAPNGNYSREVLAASLWREAMDILQDVFIAKGICYPQLTAEIIDFPNKSMAVQSSW